MDPLEKVSLENKILEFKAFSGRDILNQQSALFILEEHDPMHLSLWPSVSPRSLRLLSPTLS